MENEKNPSDKPPGEEDATVRRDLGKEETVRSEEAKPASPAKPLPSGDLGE